MIKVDSERNLIDSSLYNATRFFIEKRGFFTGRLSSVTVAMRLEVTRAIVRVAASDIALG